MTYQKGADYSWARPGGAALAAAGVKGVGRYLATDGRGITQAEYAELKNHRVNLWLCYEGAATGMLGGYAKGVSDGHVARSCMASAGIPAGSVVYAAADWDVTAAQFAACDAYLRGFQSVLGSAGRAIYGGLFYLNHVYSAGLADWFWCSASTSFAHGQAAQMTIHLQQTVNTPPVPGTDYDKINTMTYGQVGSATAPTEEEYIDMKIITVTNGTIALIGEFDSNVYTSTAGGQGFSIGSNSKAYGRVDGLTSDEVTTLVNESNGRRAALIADVVAALKPASVVVDVEALAESLAPKITAGATVPEITAAITAALSAVPVAVASAIGTAIVTGSTKAV